MRKISLLILFIIVIFDCPVLAKDIYVSPSADGDFTTITDAYNADSTVDGDVIILAPVEYLENLTFQSKRVTLRGESPELRDQTIIAGGESVTAYIVDSAHGTVFKDLTVKHQPGKIGSGLYIGANNISIINCQVTGNISDENYGSALYAGGCDDLIISDCNIHLNSANDYGGIIYLGGCENVMISNCQIHNNNTYGTGGIVQMESSEIITFKNCEFYENNCRDKGGALCLRQSDLQCVNCKFINNTVDADDESITDKARGGAIYLDDTELILSNCVFSGNTVTGQAVPLGGAIYSIESAPVITNCTFYQNFAQNSGRGGAIYNSDNSKPLISNCIFRLNNSNGEITNASTAHPQIRYSLVYGSGGSDNWDTSIGEDLGSNIDGYPYFNSSEDLTLKRISPCIDAGRSELLGLDTADVDNDGDTFEWIPFDVDGNPRFSNALHRPDMPNMPYPSIDMGAYEYHGIPSVGLIGDIDGSGIVDLLDFQLMAGNWLKTTD